MAIFLLDTDMLSLHQRNHPQVLAAVNRHATDQLCICTVTPEEQIGGWSSVARSAKTPQDEEHAAMLLAAFVVSWNRFAPMKVPPRAVFYISDFWLEVFYCYADWIIFANRSLQ